MYFEFLDLVIQKRRIFLSFFLGFLTFLSFRIPLSISQFLITSHWSSSEVLTAQRKGSNWKLPMSDASIKPSSGSLSFIGNAWDKEKSSKTKIVMVFIPWVQIKNWWWLSYLVKIYTEVQSPRGIPRFAGLRRWVFYLDCRERTGDGFHIWWKYIRKVKGSPRDPQICRNT